jgi:predicted DNA-binding transcriptional regulator AlpA
MSQKRPGSVLDIKDTDPLNMKELAEAMRVSRSTVYNWIKMGYSPEFGRRSTLSHLQNWLRTVYAPMIEERRRSRNREIEALLSKLR